jgi:hypothetical protein
MQERRHVKTTPGEPFAAPEFAPHPVRREEGGNVQMDDINIPLVAITVAFFGILLAVLVVSIHAWFYSRQAAERVAKTLPQDDPATWVGAIHQRERERISSSGSEPTSTAPNAPLKHHIPIHDAMALIQKEYASPK